MSALTREAVENALSHWTEPSLGTDLVSAGALASPLATGAGLAGDRVLLDEGDHLRNGRSSSAWAK